jgi:hypothetical protein
VSWYQEHALQSLRLIRDTGVALDASIIDVAAAPPRCDDLLAAAAPSPCSTCGDVCGGERRGSAASRGGRWIEADVTSAELPAHGYDVWRDARCSASLTRPMSRLRRCGDPPVNTAVTSSWRPSPRTGRHNAAGFRCSATAPAGAAEFGAPMLLAEGGAPHALRHRAAVRLLLLPPPFVVARRPSSSGDSTPRNRPASGIPGVAACLTT